MHLSFGIMCVEMLTFPKRIFILEFMPTLILLFIGIIGRKINALEMLGKLSPSLTLFL